MTYLRSKEAVRAYMDSNAGQFARAGNPWDGEGENRPKGGRPAKPKIAPVKKIANVGDFDPFTNAQAKLNMAVRLKALRGQTRIAEPIVKPAPIVFHHKHEREHDALSSANIAAERDRLARAAAAARADCDKVKASSFAKLCADYAERMSAAL